MKKGLILYTPIVSPRGYAILILQNRFAPAAMLHRTLSSTTASYDIEDSESTYDKLENNNQGVVDRSTFSSSASIIFND